MPLEKMIKELAVVVTAAILFNGCASFSSKNHIDRAIADSYQEETPEVLGDTLSWTERRGIVSLFVLPKFLSYASEPEGLDEFSVGPRGGGSQFGLSFYVFGTKNLVGFNTGWLRFDYGNRNKGYEHLDFRVLGLNFTHFINDTMGKGPFIKGEFGSGWIKNYGNRESRLVFGDKKTYRSLSFGYWWNLLPESKTFKFLLSVQISKYPFAADVYRYEKFKRVNLLCVGGGFLGIIFNGEPSDCSVTTIRKLKVKDVRVRGSLRYLSLQMGLLF